MQPGVYRVSHPGVVMLYSLTVTRGMSIVGLMRSPFRRPVGERLFRVFWLGAPGRWLLKAAARRVPVSGSITRVGPPTNDIAVVQPMPSGATAAAPVHVEHSIPERLHQLEQRVDALERR